MNFKILIFIFLFLPISKMTYAANSCDKLVEIFKDNHTEVKLRQVKGLMNQCLVEANDSDYIDTPINTETESVTAPILNKEVDDNSCQEGFTINSTVKYGNIKIRERTSTKDLTAFMSNSDQIYDEEFQNLHTKGLMYSNFFLKIRPEVISNSRLKLPNKIELCQHLSNINYETGYEDLLVYISSDTRKQSCEYYFTLRHELIHAAIGRQVLREYAPLIDKHIEKIFLHNSLYSQTVPFLQPPDTSSFMNMVKDKINNEILNPIQLKITQELKTRNDKFDYDEFKYRQQRLNYFCSR